MAIKWASAAAAGGGNGSEGNPFTLAELQAAAASGDTLVLVGTFDAQSLTLTSLSNVVVVSGHLVGAYSRGKLRNRTLKAGTWANIPTTNAYTIALAATPWRVCVDWDTTNPDAYGFRACHLQRRSTAVGVQSNSNSFHTDGATLTINLGGDDPATKTIHYAVSRPGIFFSGGASNAIYGIEFEWCGNDNGAPVEYGALFIDNTGNPPIVAGCLFTECGYHASGSYSTSGVVKFRDIGNTYIGCQNDSCTVTYSGSGSVSDVVHFGNVYYCSTPLKRGVASTPIFNQSESGAQGAQGIASHQGVLTAMNITSVRIENCTFVSPPYTRTGTGTTNSNAPIISRNNPVPSDTSNPNTYAVYVKNCTATGFDMLNPLAPYAHAYVGCRMDFGGAPAFVTGGVGIGLVGRIMGGGVASDGYIGSFGTQWSFDLDTTSGNNAGGAFFIAGGTSTASITGVSTGNPPTATTGGIHNLSVGQRVFLAGFTTSADINGWQTVGSIPTTTSFTISGVNVTSVTDGVGTYGTWNRTYFYFDKSTVYDYGDNTGTAQPHNFFRWTSSVDAAGNGSVTARDSVFAFRNNPAAAARFLVNTDTDSDVTAGARDFKRCIYGNIGTYSSNGTYNTEAEWLALIDTVGQAYAAAIVEPASGSGTLTLGSKYRNPPKGIAPSKSWLGSNGYPTSLSPGSSQFNASLARSKGWSRCDRVSR